MTLGGGAKASRDAAELLARLSLRLARDALRTPTNNLDRLRFPAQQGPRAVPIRRSLRALASIARRSADASVFAAQLADDRSREIYRELLAFRVLGERHVTLSRNGPAYWAARDAIAAERLLEPKVARVGAFDLDLYRVDGREGPIELEAHPLNVLNTFALAQYELHRGDASICARAGDVVIDAGGCWGDTALYFADAVGPSGKVFCFEFEAANLEVLRRNLARNPRLASRVELVERAVWSRSGEAIAYTPGGPGTSLARGAPARATARAETISLDDFASAAGLAAVDLLKTDIEGAEAAALAGAERTIARHRPTLAISVYHSLDDLTRLPARLIERSAGLGYRFYLEHFTIHQEETVLFASRGRA